MSPSPEDDRLLDLLQRAIPPKPTDQVTESTSLTMAELKDARNKIRLFSEIHQKPYVINELEEP